MKIEYKKTHRVVESDYGECAGTFPEIEMSIEISGTVLGFLKNYDFARYEKIMEKVIKILEETK